MAEAVTRSYKIIFRFLRSVFLNNSIQFCIIGISEKYRFNVGIIHTYMFHPVFFLVTAGQFMLLDNTIHIIGNIGTYYQTILSLTIHGLCIHIIVFLFVLHQPTFVLKHPEILSSLVIHLRIMLVCTCRKVYFRFDDMIK